MNFVLSLFLLSSVPDSVATYYADGNVDRLVEICTARSARADELLCRYRLFALTTNDDYLEGIDQGRSTDSARELALLSGLWGYRAGVSTLARKIRYGRRSVRLLDRARRADPDDPFVLLIEGQSLIFRPKVFGGDYSKALVVFRKLRAMAAETILEGISLAEIDLWIWYAMHKLGDPASEKIQMDLLAQDPPSMFRRFLLGPP